MEEYTFEDVLKARHEEGWEEGREDERKEILMLFDQGLSIEEIRQRLEKKAD